MKTVINDEEWQFLLLSDDKYEDVISDEEGECAETNVDTRTVAFKASQFNLSVVIHEMFHVLWSYGSIANGTTAKMEDFEESAAYFVERHILKILSKSVIIYNRLAPKADRIPTRSAKQLCQLLSVLAAKKQ